MGYVGLIVRWNENEWTTVAMDSGTDWANLDGLLVWVWIFYYFLPVPLLINAWFQFLFRKYLIPQLI